MPRARRNNTKTPGPATSPATARRILAVEDSPTQAERLRFLLEDAGYAVEVAADGEAALERIRGRAPDLIVSDVVMPRMDGYAFCRAVKSSRETRHVPVVLLTSRRTPADIIRGLEHGADNFITKPFEDAYLLERIHRIFEHLEHRKRGRFEMEVALRVAGHELVLNADKQQIVELLLATSEELNEANGQLEQSKRTTEEYARTLEERVRERTRQLAEAEARYRTLVEQVPAVIYIADPERMGPVLYMSPQIEALLGFPPDQWTADPGLWTRQTHPDDRERVHAEFARLRATGRPASSEYRMLTRDGRLVWVRDETRMVPPAESAERVVQGVLLDITEKKQAEMQLRHQRDMLAQTEKLAAMSSLVAGVAHELNNPLSVILGQTSLLRRIAEGKAAERAEKIALSAERCARIVKNFLALARQQPPERARVFLNQVVQEALELVAYPLRVDGIEVATELAPELPALWADPYQLQQVVVNLATNAHHALRKGPQPRRVKLSTRVDGETGHIVLTVADNGSGIPPEALPRIFEPFFTTKPMGQGTGLGLSLCRGILETHGGTLTAENEPGGGAVFRVELPVEWKPAAAAPKAPPPEAPRPIGAKSILVVDDEAELAGLLADVLCAEGHRVATAENGIRALERLRERSYDLIVSDIKMPELDGPGLHREVERAHPELARRFVFVTGDTLASETAEFLERTGAPSLAKPFDIEEILRVVGKALGTA